MKILLRAVVTGFGLSLGSALYKKASKHFGFDDDDKAKEKEKEEADKRTNQQDGGTDPGLQNSFS